MIDQIRHVMSQPEPTHSIQIQPDPLSDILLVENKFLNILRLILKCRVRLNFTYQTDPDRIIQNES